MMIESLTVIEKWNPGSYTNFSYSIKKRHKRLTSLTSTATYIDDAPLGAGVPPCAELDLEFVF
jgi:ribosomal protein S2